MVLPEDDSDIQIVEGEDYVTLLTCTPYGINDHRLLVRGTRIPYEEEAKEIATTPPTQDDGEEQLSVEVIVTIAVIGSCYNNYSNNFVDTFLASRQRTQK